MINAVNELWEAIKAEWGETVTYEQAGANDLTITAVRGNYFVATAGIAVEEISLDAYEWIVHQDSLVDGMNKLVPARGARIVTASETFEVTPRFEAEPFRHVGQVKTLYRIFTEEVSGN